MQTPPHQNNNRKSQHKQLPKNNTQTKAVNQKNIGSAGEILKTEKLPGFGDRVGFQEYIKTNINRYYSGQAINEVHYVEKQVGCLRFVGFVLLLGFFYAEEEVEEQIGA